MNNNGQVFLVGLMLGIAAFMLAMVFINPITDVITEARAADQLDCSNSSITDGKKMTCLMVDLILPIFIGICIGLAGAYVTAKFV
ncbi:unnamed protein product [marine sediment metagenome]|uniref:Uncharacterized protein n=1 Tax=marine sediment metagenome TaxID=412755 RepID=X1B2J6_9ZZZZ